MREDVPQSSRVFAKTQRTNATQAERRLWSIVRAGQLDGHRFKRQVPVDGYVLDFVCFEAKLIVEADGGHHADSEHDARRDRHFAEAGFRTLRFWNEAILGDAGTIAAAILLALREG